MKLMFLINMIRRHFLLETACIVAREVCCRQGKVSLFFIHKLGELRVKNTAQHCFRFFKLDLNQQEENIS